MKNYLIYTGCDKKVIPCRILQNFKQRLFLIEPKNLAISRYSRWARKASEIYLRESEKTAGESLTGLSTCLNSWQPAMKISLPSFTILIELQGVTDEQKDGQTDAFNDT